MQNKTFAVGFLLVGLIATTANILGWQPSEESSSAALMLQVQLPIELKTSEQLINSIDQAVARLTKMQSTTGKHQRPFLILRFLSNPQHASSYEACNVLASRLENSDIRTRCRTVALLEGKVTDHVLLPALACEQIFVAPETTIGPLTFETSDQPGAHQAMLEDYHRLARSNQLLPQALVDGLLDSTQTVYELTHQEGITYATQPERDRLSAAGGFTKETTISEAGELLQLSSTMLSKNHIPIDLLPNTDTALRAELNIAPNLFIKDAVTIGDQRPVLIDLRSTNSSGNLTANKINETSLLVKQLVDDGYNWLGFQVDSSGGDYSAILHLSNTIAELEHNIQTVAFVENQALESTALVVLACDEIFLSQRATIGGAGNQPLSSEELLDIQPPIKKLALSKQRAWSIYPAAVDPKLAIHIYRQRLTGEQLAFCSEQWNDQPQSENWQKQELVETHDGFNSAELRQLGLTNQTMDSIAQVLQHYGLDTTIEPQTQRPWVAAIEEFAKNGWFANIMLTIGIWGLITEIGTPGLGIPGILSLVCFGLFLWSKELNGTVNALEVVLIIIGLLCIALELFVIPGFGLFGFSGLGLVLVGLVLASQTFVIPQNDFQTNLMLRSITTIIASSLIVVLLYVFLTRTLSDTWLGKMLAPARSSAQEQADTQWSESLVHWEFLTGLSGTTITPLSPAGKVKIEDKVYDVISDGKMVDVGSQIKVVDVKGNRIVVSVDV